MCGHFGNSRFWGVFSASRRACVKNRRKIEKYENAQNSPNRKRAPRHARACTFRRVAPRFGAQFCFFPRNRKNGLLHSARACVCACLRALACVRFRPQEPLRRYPISAASVQGLPRPENAPTRSPAPPKIQTPKTRRKNADPRRATPGRDTTSVLRHGSARETRFGAKFAKPPSRSGLVGAVCVSCVSAVVRAFSAPGTLETMVD